MSSEKEDHTDISLAAFCGDGEEDSSVLFGFITFAELEKV